jgi:hypothetical protein
MRKPAPCLFGFSIALISAFFAASSAGTETHWLSSCAKPGAMQPDADIIAQFETLPVIHAARGESEAIQLLVVAPTEGLEDLRVTVGEFSHVSGDVWEAGSIEWNFVGFVTTREPYYGTLRVGEWPDPLLSDTRIAIGPGRAQPIWIEAAVPRDAEAGRYEGEIVLEAKGWRHVLPLAIEVWAFDLPARSSLPSSFLLYPRYVFQYHGLERGTPAADDMLRRYYDAMLTHGIMPTHVAMGPVASRPALDIEDDGELSRGSFAAFDAQVQWAMERGQTVFGLEGPRQMNPRTATWYRSIGAHIAAKGWEGRFYTYLFDETYEGVDEMTAFVGRNAPGLHNLITRLPADGYPAVDWWCPRLGDAMMRAAEVDRWLAANAMNRSDLWVYTAGNAGSDVPALHLDVPGIEARVTAMAVWREGFAGLLFWCVNHWTVDPWIDPMVFPRQNGNGALLYPGPRGPVLSQRLKLLRDGFEDVDYAALLTERSDDLSTRILAALPLKNALDWERDPRVWSAWRLAAGYYLGGDEARAASLIGKLEAKDDTWGAGSRRIGDADNPERGWHGADGMRVRSRAKGERILSFTLDRRKHKIWCKPSPRDWRGHRDLLIDITLVEGDATVLNVKLGSGLVRQRRWTWELHLAPGVRRRLRIPIPHERVNTASLGELTIFVWEPESARSFELGGIWLD